MLLSQNNELYLHEMKTKVSTQFQENQFVLPSISRGMDKLCVLFWNEFRL